MIQANELRLGNLVIFSEISEINSIKEISTTGIVCSNGISDEWIELEYFEPISLTPDWLIKFGFRDGYFPDHNMFGVSIDGINGYMVYFEYKFIGCNLKYVHQLQNLYFVLYGQELELIDTSKP